MSCENCGRPSKYTLCYRCKETKVRDEAYALGYQTGLLKGQQGAALALTTERWRQLMQLCHPDKHGGSKTATDVLQWLNTVKP